MLPRLALGTEFDVVGRFVLRIVLMSSTTTASLIVGSKTVVPSGSDVNDISFCLQILIESSIPTMLDAIA